MTRSSGLPGTSDTHTHVHTHTHRAPQLPADIAKVSFPSSAALFQAGKPRHPLSFRADDDLRKLVIFQRQRRAGAEGQEEGSSCRKRGVTGPGRRQPAADA